ncbi:MAG: UDP-N-acetylglucosamine--N-acetylmuramyl-(pentapeptide) pyrophosphoryl-undecaprenol N-acetylglucosamine transferase [Candidatus Zixiibacteriota bacterium]
MAAGGTGGHLIPAIRIAEGITRRQARAEFLFAGSDRGFEESVVTARGYRYVGLPARGLSRSRIWRNVGAVFANLRTARLARRHVRDFHPDAAVGCGGYAAYFPIHACAAAGVPYVLQEQNRIPGLTTRWLAKRAEVTFTAFAESRDHLPKARHVEWVGNPIDPRLATLDQASARRTWGLEDEARVVLITGGSTGARAINRNVARGLSTPTPDGLIVVLWQTGAQGADWNGKAATGWTVRPFAFTDRMTEAFVAADLIISRAGALTVSEICAAGKPAVLIPYPLATADHQTHNARTLVEVGGAILIEDNRLGDVSLLELAGRLLADRDGLGRMSEANRSLARPQAADLIARRVIDLAYRPHAARAQS